MSAPLPSMFRLTDDQRRLKERARRFAEEVVASYVEEMDRTNNYPWPLVKAMVGERFMGMTIGPKYGGDGRSLLDVVLVVEEIAKVCGTVARIVVDGNMGIVRAIDRFGTEAQRRRYLPMVLEGEKPAIAITEPEAGSAATSLTTRARAVDGGGALDGEKRWITGAGVSRLYLVFARFGDVPGAPGIGGLLVEASTPGLSVPKVRWMMGLRGMPEGDVVFRDCRVPAENLLVGPGDGFKKLMTSYNAQRVGAATVALGIAAGAFELAVAYAKTREQFGRRIGDFQGLQWMLADMHRQLEGARLMIYHAAANAGDDFPDAAEAATAKVAAAQMAIDVTNAALQIHGAVGYSCELPLERMVRDARMFAIGGGTVEMQKNLIAARVLGRQSAG
jgi:alkylation response protein AidB-like acyl-CoA dehydrogenase